MQAAIDQWISYFCAVLQFVDTESFKKKFRDAGYQGDTKQCFFLHFPVPASAPMVWWDSADAAYLLALLKMPEITPEFFSVLCPVVFAEFSVDLSPDRIKLFKWFVTAANAENVEKVAVLERFVEAQFGFYGLSFQSRIIQSQEALEIRQRPGIIEYDDESECAPWVILADDIQSSQNINRYYVGLVPVLIAPPEATQTRRTVSITVSDGFPVLAEFGADFIYLAWLIDTLLGFGSVSAICEKHENLEIGFVTLASAERAEQLMTLSGAISFSDPRAIRIREFVTAETTAALPLGLAKNLLFFKPYVPPKPIVSPVSCADDLAVIPTPRLATCPPSPAPAPQLLPAAYMDDPPSAAAFEGFNP